MEYCPILPYNYTIKIAGTQVTIKKYEKEQIYNYLAHNTANNQEAINILDIFKEFIEGLKDPRKYYKQQVKYRVLIQIIEKKKKERYIKSLFRARNNIFDLVACNVNKHKSYNNKIEKTKFLTLTFKENITDIKKANAELTKFFKRLSYYAYNINKNVIKYIAVPEMQKRGAWHYHIVLFNVKYIPFNKLMKIWNNGSVYINAIKTKDNALDIAKYITKYITKALKINNDKGIEQNYKIYKEKKLENMKRYSCSRKLYKPFEAKLKLNNYEASLLLKCINKLKKADPYIKKYENEFRGEIKIMSVEVEKTKDIITYIKTLALINQNQYSQKIDINWNKLKNIIKKIKRYIDEDEEYEKLYWKYAAYEQKGGQLA